MSRLAHQESGFTLVEVLLVSLLLSVVLGATLAVMEQFQRTTDRNQRLNDQQDAIRSSVDLMTREMRNLASPTNEEPRAVNRAEPQDLIFMSVAGQKPAGSLNVRNARHVRYCLNSGTLWRQELTWTTAVAPAFPPDTTCPGSGWGSNRVMARAVTNEARAVFNYNAPSTQLDSITEVGVTLFIDSDPGRSPKEVALQSAAFLRNQNRFPVATFTAQRSGATIILNASDSSDPEQRPMSFYWYDQGRTDNSCGVLPAGIPADGCVGSGLVFNYAAPAGARTVYLIAVDHAGLQSQASSQTL